MRLYAILFLVMFLMLSAAGCQKNDTVPTQMIAIASPTATWPIGVSFVTVTPGSGPAVPTVASELPTSTPQEALATPTPEFYLVRAGDTLVDIASARGTTLDEILALNPGIQPELLLVGQAIAVPPLPTIAAVEPVVATGPLAVEIRGLSTYPSAAGGTWVLGEVINTGPESAELVRVKVSLESSADEVLSSEDVWLTPATMPSMSRAPFGVLFPEVRPGEATPTAEVVGGRLVYQLGSRYLNLAVVDAEVTIGRSPIRVSGQVENQGQQPARHISVVTTFYDEQEAVTGYHELSLGEIIEPGESRPFEFIALPPGGSAAGFAFAVQATAVQ
jgi:LysM repeat protein